MNATTDRLAQLAISPTGFVFDPRSGASFTVNATGRMLLEGLRDGCLLDELVERLGGAFDVGQHDLRRDALEYVRLLRDQGLVPTDFQLD
jgi:hypothetical protein